jgi:RimJ/RimL family protein N-acetyltransferase
MNDVIHTERLELIALTPGVMRASLEGNRSQAERLLGASLPSGWPDAHYQGLLALRLRQIESDPMLQPWVLRALMLRTSCEVIGHIGCHAAPGADYLQQVSPGAVEFGYRVLPAFRRRGYAREASLGLMHWAHRSHGVSKFVVSIRPDNAASQALAAQLGFTRIGSHIDEVDGLEEILERQVFDGDDLLPARETL